MKRIAIWNPMDFRNRIYDSVNRSTFILKPNQLVVFEFDYSAACLSTGHYTLPNAQKMGCIRYWVLD